MFLESDFLQSRIFPESDFSWVGFFPSRIFPESDQRCDWSRDGGLDGWISWVGFFQSRIRGVIGPGGLIMIFSGVQFFPSPIVGRIRPEHGGGIITSRRLDSWNFTSRIPAWLDSWNSTGRIWAWSGSWNFKGPIRPRSDPWNFKSPIGPGSDSWNFKSPIGPGSGSQKLWLVKFQESNRAGIRLTKIIKHINQSNQPNKKTWHRHHNPMNWILSMRVILLILPLAPQFKTNGIRLDRDLTGAFKPTS